MVELYPTRLRIMRKLTEILSGITPANGYKHDLASKVFRGRMFVTVNSPLPMVSIMENIDPDRYPREAGGGHGHIAALVASAGFQQQFTIRADRNFKHRHQAPEAGSSGHG